MHKYPITRNFDNQEVVGWVELREDVEFTMLNVLAPETNFREDGKPELKSFGLIPGDNYLKDPNKIYGKISGLKKNANKGVKNG